MLSTPFDQTDVLSVFDQIDVATLFCIGLLNPLANPFDEADNTKSDFSKIGRVVDADQDKARQTLVV